MKKRTESINTSPELTAAITNLAAALIARDPSMSLGDAIRAATQSVREIELKRPTPNQIQESVTRDYIVCFEDGTQHVMLRRYLRRKFNMTPEKYREKWGLPDNYPMTAPSYSAQRSKIAKKNKFGKN